MKKTSKLLHIFFNTIILVSLLVSCAKNTSSLKSGRFLSEDKFSYVEIDSKSKSFTFQRGVTSYRPSGKYLIEKDRLLLLNNEDSDQVDFEFLIKDNTIIFKKGELAESIVEKDSVFFYQDH